MMPRLESVSFGLLVVASSLTYGLGAAADEADNIDAFARVVVAETALRSGPGVGHRVIYRATRGETFLIEGR